MKNSYVKAKLRHTTTQLKIIISSIVLGDCSCNYHPGGCKIAAAATKGNYCVCRMAYFWTCNGWERPCPRGKPCPENCYTKECCELAAQYNEWGKVDCGGY